MEVIPEVPPLSDLITSLEQSTLLAKQLSTTTTTDSTQFLHLCSSLQNTTHQLTSFLNHIPSSQPPPQAEENSVSSAVGGDEEPMQIGDDDQEADNTHEENSEIVIDKVEERLRNFVIQNKRRKRPLSPTSAALEPRGFNNDGDGVLVHAFDPHATRLRSFDIVFQFHG